MALSGCYTSKQNIVVYVSTVFSMCTICKSGWLQLQLTLSHWPAKGLLHLFALQSIAPDIETIILVFTTCHNHLPLFIIPLPVLLHWTPQPLTWGIILTLWAGTCWHKINIIITLQPELYIREHSSKLQQAVAVTEILLHWYFVTALI